MIIEVEFVKSAAAASDLPRDHLVEIAMVGRSNVGKSSLINALVRQRVARTSAAPGKTRLANIFKIARGASTPFYLVDLPGYGYARGGEDSAREFEELTRAFFGRVGQTLPASPGRVSALLLVDSRHPGLRSDLETWRWLNATVPTSAIVATKIDKLARGERIRALRELQSVFDAPVLPASATTGEGLDELWKLIDTLATRNNNPRLNNRRNSLPSQTAPRARRETPARAKK